MVYLILDIYGNYGRTCYMAKRNVLGQAVTGSKTELGRSPVSTSGRDCTAVRFLKLSPKPLNYHPHFEATLRAYA